MSIQKWALITGATSGLGEGLVYKHLLAGWGVIALGRTQGKLAAVLDAAAQGGWADQVKTSLVDVTDFEELEQTIRRHFATEPQLFRVIANAGMAYTKPVGQLGLQGLRQVIETNVTAACVTIDVAASELIARQKAGHLVGISSVAGVRGLPKNAVYSASKAALSTFLESARLDLRAYPIAVSDLRPGFIDTPINQGMKHRPFVIERDKGVERLMAAIEQQAAVAYVPSWPWSVLSRGLKLIPDRVLCQIK